MRASAQKWSQVVLICILVSVYTLISVSKGTLTGQQLVRAKRQSPSDNNNAAADVSSSDNALSITTNSDASTQPSPVVMDTSLASGNIESSPVSNVLEVSNVASTELTSYIEDTPSLSVIDQTNVSPVLWPSNTDTTMALQQSDYLLIDSTFIYQTMAAMPSDLLSLYSYDIVAATSVLPDMLSLSSYDIVAATSVLPDMLSLSSTFLDKSLPDFPTSNISFLDESTILQEGMFSSNFVDKSTIDLDWDSISSDSNILSESSAVVNYDILSSDFIFSNDFSLVLPTDVLLTDSNQISVSATEFLEESLISYDISTILPTAVTDMLETTSLIWETPELSLATTESFESMMEESLESSLTNVDYSESLTPNLDSSSLILDLSQIASSESVTTELSWLDGATVTPAITSDMLTSLTTMLEYDSATMIMEALKSSVTTSVMFGSTILESNSLEPSSTSDYYSENMSEGGATTVITQTTTATYPIETPTLFHATPSVSDGVSSSSVAATTIPATTTTNNISGSLPAKSTQTDDDDEALSTGGKIAIGILIPVAIICLVLFGLFFYRRYRLNHESSKAFMHPGVRYRTYSNAAYKDEEIAMDGTWRSNH